MRKASRDAQSAWVKRYLAPLVGMKIVKVGVTADGYPQITVRGDDGNEWLLEIAQDEEGNGPGFVFGLPETK